MIEQTGHGLTFYFTFIESKLGKTGLTIAVSIYQKSIDDWIVEDEVGFEAGRGLYYYTLAGASAEDASDYVAHAVTATTSVDCRVSYAMWVVGTDWVERIDALISETAVPGDEMALVPDTTINAVFTQTPAEIIAALTGSRLTIYRDSDWTARVYIAGGISASRDDLLFTVKTSQKKDAGADDSESIIQFSENEGLLYLNGEPGEAAEGWLTVVDEMNDDGNGVVDLRLTSWAAAQLAKDSGYTYDGKVIEAGADLVRVEGLLDVKASVTRTIS